MEMKNYKSVTSIYRYGKTSRVKHWFWGLMIFLCVLLFLPWTQNIRSRGSVTTLYQDQRPQELNTIIGGQVMKWYIKEGDYVKAGDTIIQLSEVKVDYLDPNLLNRTQEQLQNKQLSVDYYKGKVGATGQQINALGSERDLKIQQTLNKMRQQQRKVESDSLDVAASLNELSVAKRQLDASKNMLDSGVISLVDYEKRKVTYQNTTAKNISNQNKYDNAKQELTILRIEMNSIEQAAAEKINKAIAEQYQSQSQIASGQADVAKLQNQYTSYSIRNGMYYITAPQSGQVVQAKKAGIGEYVKEGDLIVEIVPDKVKYAVELFVRPLDLPLIDKGQKVRFWFDGFPAIVFSGWPNASYGTFGGKVVAVENTVSNNGQFRVLVAEDPDDKPWPKELRMGAGAQGMALLKNVPIWYELWRNVNGFPPDYYKPKQTETLTVK
jgi:multidrug efflux pump subunit AcrA (membrane-fusion protein)